MERRLAAILAADVVGYSALMGEDEGRALATIRRLREELFEPEVTRHRGIVFKRTGDGWLVEFASVVDAVLCAIAVQRTLLDEDVALRIGVHIGDIIHEGGEIYGNGVNIAARLEATGAPGLVLISEEARRQVAASVEIPLHDNGEMELKNIAEPVKVWSWPEPLAKRPVITGPDTGGKPKVHIAVFESRGTDAEELAEGVADDLATALSPMTSMQLVETPQAADYLVTGAIRAGQGRWRISAKLTNRANDSVIWSDRRDEEGNDLFDLQDRCVFRLSAALRVRIVHQETLEQRGRSIEDMSVEDFLNAARACYAVPTLESWESSIPLLERAISLDPDNWMAVAMLAASLNARTVYDWRRPDPQRVQRQLDLLERAVRLNSGGDFVHMARAMTLVFNFGDFDQARAALDQALTINPNLHESLWIKSSLEAFDGDADLAVNYVQQAVESDPGGPFQHIYYRFAGYAYMAAGNWENALGWFRRADQLAPGTAPNLVALAASSWLTGNKAAAHEAVQALMEIAPEFSLADLAPLRFSDSSRWAQIETALEAAGAPR